MSSTHNTDEIIANLEEFQKNILMQALQSGMDEVLNFVEGESRKNTPIDDGRLKTSIESESNINGNNVQGCLYTNVKYAIYKHEGTGIYAKKGGRKTAWIYKGKDGSFVKTNGQKPNKFLEDAVKNNTAKIKQVMKNGIKKKL